MLVLKFGGTSVADAESIKKVISIIRSRYDEGRLIIVASALGGITDSLIHCANLAAAGNEQYRDELSRIEQRHLQTVKGLLPLQQQSAVLSLVRKSCNEIDDFCGGVLLLGELSARTRDRIIGYGELLSSQIICAAFVAYGLPAEWQDARALIRTDGNHGHAAVEQTATYESIGAALAKSNASCWIVPGFIASSTEGATTTLGRGGSDYTAAIFAAAVDARSLEIWTDVSGMMTADPRWVSNARPIQSISYLEAMELSHFGAKVIYPPTIQPVMSKGIPVWVKNTFAPDDYGTLIESRSQLGDASIRGISSVGNIALLSLEGSGMIGVPGFSKRLFESLSAARINVILITQGSSEHSICVGVESAAAEKAREAVNQAFETEIANQRLEPLIVEKELSILAVVGEGMKSHPGISGKMFGALGRNGVNVRAIAQGSSERNISAVISSKDVRKALNVLHEEFFETVYKQINLFIVGTGNVGSKLLGQLQQQANYLMEHLRLQVRVIGIANSRKMLARQESIGLGNWRKELDHAEEADLDRFVEIVFSSNLRNSVFIDVTASERVASVYDKLLQKSVAVVACNKISASSSYQSYKRLKELSREYNAPFLFETNVGAGLPVIATLGDLIRSGDKVQKIQAVLSGTLNFVFNEYNGTKSFSSIVRQAQDEGYTEPDPRLDLSGTDVMRKIMILAREAGEVLDMSDITCEGFVPDSCLKGSVEDFYIAMEQEEAHFRSLYEASRSKGNSLKFVASYENGKASVGLQQIPPGHDLYHLYGKDNVILFYTERYPQLPMVVKGAGAGAEVTASGVFSDIIRAAR